MFLGIIGQDPSVSKCDRLHIDIFRFSFTDLKVYSVDSSKLIGNFPEVLNLNGLILNWLSVLPIYCHSLVKVIV